MREHRGELFVKQVGFSFRVLNNIVVVIQVRDTYVVTGFTFYKCPQFLVAFVFSYKTFNIGIVCFPAEFLADLFDVFVFFPHSFRVAAFGFGKPSLLFTQNSFSFRSDPGLVEFCSADFGRDIVFKNGVERRFDEGPCFFNVRVRIELSCEDVVEVSSIFPKVIKVSFIPEMDGALGRFFPLELKTGFD